MAGRNRTQMSTLSGETGTPPPHCHAPTTSGLATTSEEWMSRDVQRLALLMDFDNTTAEQNVAELLLRRYAPEALEELRQAFRERLIGLREYQERAFRRVQATPEEMQAYVREHANLRPGFDDLVEYAQGHGIALAVVTNGLDMYVEALLGPYLDRGLSLYAVGFRLTPEGVEYHYPYERPHCRDFGNCKCAVVDAYRERGYRVAYIGDSARTDLGPALNADVRFACEGLLERFKAEGVPHLEFVDFHGVLAALEDGALRDTPVAGGGAGD